MELDEVTVTQVAEFIEVYRMVYGKKMSHREAVEMIVDHCAELMREYARKGEL